MVTEFRLNRYFESTDLLKASSRGHLRPWQLLRWPKQPPTIHLLAIFSKTVVTHPRDIGWILDQVVHVCCAVVCFELVSLVADIAMIAMWKVFASKNGGRKTFQIKSGLDTVDYVWIFQGT